MYEGSRADDLTAALHELDTAKALVRMREAELRDAIPAPSQRGCCSPKALHIFEAKARKMNVATKRYLGAVGAFTAACQKSRNQPVEEPALQRAPLIG
jgi:hypothetical protein